MNFLQESFTGSLKSELEIYDKKLIINISDCGLTFELIGVVCTYGVLVQI